MYADTNMVDTVARNLISNALKFTHSGGLVEVAATQDENMVEISVSDIWYWDRPKAYSKIVSD